MEESLIIVFQLLIEGVLEVFTYYPFDFPTASSGRKDDMFAWFIVLFIFLGGLLGFLFTLIIAPNVMLPYAWMRIANLIVGPVLSGYISYQFADKRWRKDKRIVPVRHAIYAFMFTLTFIVVRFICAHR